MARTPSGERVAFGTTGPAPVAHSIVEERLFLLTVRCACGGGPFQKMSQTLARQGPRTIDLVRARCPRCTAEREFRFDVTSFFGRFYPRRGVSDTPEPSQLLDAVAWVRWARLYFRAFEGERAGLSRDDRIDCGILALRCVDEALKLFRSGEPALEEGDLNTQGSRETFKLNRDRYGRYELMGLKLLISMLLSSAGVDPDGGDPGITHGGVVRLLEAVKRAGTDSRGAMMVAGGGAQAGLVAQLPAPAQALALPHKKIPALPAALPVGLLAAPAASSPGTPGTLVRYLTIAAIAVLASGAAIGLLSALLR